MNKIKLTVTLTCLAVMIFATTFTDRVHSQQGSQDGQQQTGAGSRSPVDGKTRRERFSSNGVIENEDVPTFSNGQSSVPTNAGP